MDMDVPVLFVASSGAAFAWKPVLIALRACYILMSAAPNCQKYRDLYQHHHRPSRVHMSCSVSGSHSKFVIVCRVPVSCLFLNLSVKRACLIQCYYRCSGHSPVFPLHRLFG